VFFWGVMCRVSVLGNMGVSEVGWNERGIGIRCHCMNSNQAKGLRCRFLFACMSFLCCLRVIVRGILRVLF
jgi:hypothetical protein